MCSSFLSFFFFNDTATTEIYTLSLHDALPIYLAQQKYDLALVAFQRAAEADPKLPEVHLAIRSEEHTSELQSRLHLVCRLLLEKKHNNLTFRGSQLGRDAIPLAAT